MASISVFFFWVFVFVFFNVCVFGGVNMRGALFLWCYIKLGGGVNESGGGPTNACVRSSFQDPLSGHQRAAQGSVA